MPKERETPLETARPRWTRIGIAMLIAAFIVWAIVDAVREFRANDTADFYSSRPERLLYVLGMAIFGGFITALYHRLSSTNQRRARLFGLGSVAAVFTTLFGYWLLGLLPLSSVFGAGGLLLLLPLMIVAALASGLWYEFFHLLKTGKTRFL